MASTTNMSHSATSAIELKSPWDGRSAYGGSSRADWYKSPEDSIAHRDLGLSPEMLDEIEAQRAQREERQRIQDILEQRPRRWEEGFWREMWSFVVVREREKIRTDQISPTEQA